MPEVKFIREVWAENLEEEMSHLRDLVEEYPYLAMVRLFLRKMPFPLVLLHAMRNLACDL
jgi:hypothetical protein